MDDEQGAKMAANRPPALGQAPLRRLMDNLGSFHREPIMSAIRLVVGLGNPGRDYEDTRHNTGFWWVDALARDLKLNLALESRFFGETARHGHGDDSLWLLKPATFMNASGKSVAALARFYKIPVEQILVVHDELDIPPGETRLKQGGGHGGHNGLKDIAAHMGSPNFWRLRLGIGHPGDRNQVVDFVLKAPRREEQELIDDAVLRSLREWPLIERGDFAAAMQRLNARRTAGA